jgi:hypothetical protein
LRMDLMANKADWQVYVTNDTGAAPDKSAPAANDIVASWTRIHKNIQQHRIHKHKCVNETAMS